MAQGSEMTPSRQGMIAPGRRGRGARDQDTAEPAIRLNQAGRPTAVELERRKARVMAVATELFVSQGYAETSLVDIARGAGVATRTLYQHFGDKEAIFHDVVFARDVGTMLATPTLSHGESLFDALMRLADYACEFALRPRSVGLMRLMVAESNRFPDLIKRIATGTFNRFRRQISAFFDELEAAGLIPPGDHARSGLLFVDLILGNTPIMMYTSWSSEAPSRGDLESRVALFVAGRFGVRPLV